MNCRTVQRSLDAFASTEQDQHIPVNDMDVSHAEPWPPPPPFSFEVLHDGVLRRG